MQKIVATYDYYTLDQARKILYREESKRKKRKARIEQIKANMILFSFYVLAPVLFQRLHHTVYKIFFLNFHLLDQL